MPRRYPHFVCIFGTRRQTDMRPKGHWSPAPAGRVSGGKKLVACFLKLVARISKSEPLIFSLLPCGINTLKTSFHFSAPENDNFIDNFPLLVETIHRLYYGNENHPAAASAGRQVSVIRAQKNAGMCDVTHMPALVRRFRPLPASSVFTPARPLP